MNVKHDRGFSKRACLCVSPLFVISDTYIPSCDEDGFYRRLQCDKSRGECWCVDQHGGELMGSRIHGNPDCGEHEHNTHTHTYTQRTMLLL